MLIDECQDADERVVNKSIGPMGASTNATMVFIGTPSYHKGVFYKTIQMNKRQATKRGARTEPLRGRLARGRQVEQELREVRQEGDAPAR
jgi:hypothetical protein